MARINNEVYAGNGSPWASAVSNLGMALFGDPSEALRRKQAEQEQAYREEQMAGMKLQRQQLELNMKQQAALQAQLQARLHPAAPAAAATAPVAGTAPAVPAGAATMPVSGTVIPPAVPNTSLATMMTEPEGPLPQIETQALLAPTPQEMQAGQRTSTVMPQQASVPIPEVGQPIDYYDNLGQRESGGNWTAQAPTSSAYGKYQITDRTGRGLDMPADHAAWTPDVQQAGIEKLTGENLARARQVLGHEPTDADLYAFHHFAPDSAARIAQAPYNTPMSQVVNPAELAANPYLANLTVGKWYEQVMSGEKGGAMFGAGQSFAGRPDASLANSDLFAGDQAITTEPLAEPSPSLTQATGPVPIGQEAAPIASQAVPLPSQKPDLAAMFAEQPTDMAPAVDTSVAPPAPTDPAHAAIAATGATGGFDPNDPFAGLNETEIAALSTLPPDKLQEGLSKLLLDKAKHQGTGAFQGDSMDAQLLNVIYDYETKRHRGEPTTPEEDYAYKLAVYKVRAPKQFVDPTTHEVVEYTPGELPVMDGQQPAATTGETPASTEVPTQGTAGTQQQQPTADPLAQPPPDATTQLRTIKPGTLPAMNEGQSKDLNWWGSMDSAQGSLDQAVQMGAAPNSLRNYGLYQALISENPAMRAAATTMMSDGERKYAYGVREFINAYLRKQTGAAIKNEEFDMYYPIFFPMPRDSAQEVEDKKAKRQQAIDSLYVGLGKAQGYADQLKQMRHPAATTQQQQQQPAAGGNGAVALPSGTPDNPLGLNLPAR